MTRLLPAFAAIAAAGILVAGCGSDSSGGSSSSSSSGGGYGSGASKTTAPKTTAAPAAATSSSGGLTLKAVESNGLSFDQKTLTAKAGTVALTLDNPSGNSQPHAIAIEGNGVDKDGQTVQPGGTSKVSATLKAGTYTFYCPVPGHRQAGMEGTLTVQ
jgi:plastocyanin